MRWRKDIPKSGDRRVARKFLWFPKEIDGDVRWLEFASIEQECTTFYVHYYGYVVRWEDVAWS